MGGGGQQGGGSADPSDSTGGAVRGQSTLQIALHIMMYCPLPQPMPFRPYSLYLKLQRVYREKAEADISAVEAHVQV